MTFTFVHTADWQVGKPFRAFAERKAGVLEDARLTMLDRLAELAATRGAAHVLVAGDIFDSETMPNSALARPIERLAARAGVTWHLLPGNHDPARSGGVWDRVQRRGLPANVVVHAEPVVREIAPGVWLLPAPLTSRDGATDPTAWMDTAPTPAGAIRIGLAHGSIRDFGGGGEAEAVIAPDRAARARLDYLALGDWHGMTRVDARTWYSGTPEPDRFPDNEPGHALVVRVEGAGAVPEVEVAPTARFRWIRHAAVLTSAADLQSIERALVGAAPDADRVLLRLAVSGRLPALGHAALASWRERIEPRLFHLEIDDSGLGMASGDADLDALAGDGEVTAAARWLQAIAADPNDERRRVAEAALARLLALSAQMREGADA